MSLQVITDHPIALDSRDHIVPGGTMMDNTNHPEFLQKMYGLFPNRPFALMDLGCSSGRMVEQVLRDRQGEDGNPHHYNRMAIGIDGSDYSLSRQRESWARISDNLFICDISKPFKVVSRHVVDKMRGQVTYQSLKPFQQLCGDGIQFFNTQQSHLAPYKETPSFRFDVVTCWEVMEHIPEDRLEQLVENVLEHLMPDGIWAMSISSQSGYHHRTLREKSWWLKFFEYHGLNNDHGVTSVIGQDWPRGPQEPDSFNLALRRNIQEPEV